MHAHQIILAPIVSEKSYHGSVYGKYTFKVHPDAHRTQIRHAVEELFDVHVVSVNTIKVQAKPKRRGMINLTSGMASRRTGRGSGAPGHSAAGARPGGSTRLRVALPLAPLRARQATLQLPRRGFHCGLSRSTDHGFSG